jgi:hypothetical protein
MMSQYYVAFTLANLASNEHNHVRVVEEGGLQPLIFLCYSEEPMVHHQVEHPPLTPRLSTLSLLSLHAISSPFLISVVLFLSILGLVAYSVFQHSAQAIPPVSSTHICATATIVALVAATGTHAIFFFCCGTTILAVPVRQQQRLEAWRFTRSTR